MDLNQLASVADAFMRGTCGTNLRLCLTPTGRIAVMTAVLGRKPKRAECACRVVEAALLETFGIDPQAQCRASADLILSQRVCDALNAWNGLYA